LFALTCIAAPGYFLLPPRRSLKHVVDVSTPAHYRIIYGGLAFLAVTVVGSSALFMFRPLPASMSSLYLPVDEPSRLRVHRAILLLAGWFGPIAALFLLDPSSPTVTGSGEKQALITAGRGLEAPSDDEKGEVNDDCCDNQDGSDDDTVYDPPQIAARSRSMSIVAEDLSITQMLARPSAHLFLLTCTVVVGSGTMITNNMSQMVESLGFPHRATPACLSIFSVSQALARALTGYFSDSMWRRYQLPRTVFVTVSAALGMIGHFVLAVGDDRPLFVAGVILVGFSFGMMWPLMVLIVGDLYGKRYHGANYLLYDGFASAAGTLLLAKYVTQTVYENHIQPDTGNDITCYGKACFAGSHVVASLLCFVALLSAIATLTMTRQSYCPAPN
jgi:Major Facilitator Superfamily